MGRVNIKNLQKRDIYPIDFKVIFSLNANNLQSKELANHKRRVEEASARQRKEAERLAMAESSNLGNLPTSVKKGKVKAPVVVLTEEESRKQKEQKRA